jgi:hypothetical protein
MRLECLNEKVARKGSHLPHDSSTKRVHTSKGAYELLRTIRTYVRIYRTRHLSSVRCSMIHRADYGIVPRPRRSSLRLSFFRRKGTLQCENVSSRTSLSFSPSLSPPPSPSYSLDIKTTTSREIEVDCNRNRN